MRNDTNTLLAAGAGEATTFKSVEGAFYGDLFAPTGPVEFACASQAFAVTADPNIESMRACTRPANGTTTTNCGFTFTGYCGKTYPANRSRARIRLRRMEAARTHRRPRRTPK